MDEVGDGEGNVSLGVVQMHLMMKEVRRRKKGELEGRKDQEERWKKEGGRRKEESSESMKAKNDERE